jgi:organic hydroperoxide reductase OsmC/OhrA
MDGRARLGFGPRSRTFIFWRVRSSLHLENGYMKPNASATWLGGIRRGKGVVTTGSGTLSQSQYFGTDDEEGKGTNPYELIAAAHAACFSMTLANELAGAGLTPHRNHRHGHDGTTVG